VKGTVTFDFVGTATTNYSGGGSGCTVTITARGHDTLQYATVDAVRLTLSGESGHATASVPYALMVNFGSEDSGPPKGSMPDGSACPPFGGMPMPNSGCKTYKGELSLNVTIDGGKLTVSSKNRTFVPEACTGWHVSGISVPSSVGPLPANQRSATVTGSGDESFPHPPSGDGASVVEASKFVATLTAQ